MLTAMNACGFDKDLEKSSPLGGEVRAEVKSVLEASLGAHDAAQPMCTFYHDHQGTDAAKDLSQYVSLALYMNPPPAFGFKVKEAELSPDATTVSGLMATLPKFSETAGVHKIWLGHQQEYAALTQTFFLGFLGVGGWRALALALLQAVALAIHLQDVDMVGEPAQQRARQAFRSQHPGPLLEREITGHQLEPRS